MGDTVFFGAALLCAAVGLFFVARGLFRDRSRGRRRCPKCWYDMTGVESPRCPECGKAIKRPRMLHRTRRHWRVAGLGAVFLALFVVLINVPQARRDGVWSVVPDTALVLSLGWVGDGAPWGELKRRIQDASADGERGVDAMSDWQWSVARARSVAALRDDPLVAHGPEVRFVLALAPHHRLAHDPDLVTVLVDTMKVDPASCGPGLRILDVAPLPPNDAARLLTATEIARQAMGYPSPFALRQADECGEPAWEVAVALALEAMADPSPAIRREAALLTMTWERTSPVLIEALIELAADPKSDVRSEAIRALGAFRMSAVGRDIWPLNFRVDRAPADLPPQIDDVIHAALDDLMPGVRHSAANAIFWSAAVPPADVVDRLIELAMDGSFGSSAIIALESAGPAAADAIPFLRDLAGKRGHPDRAPATRALGAVAAGDDTVVGTLLEALASDDPYLRESAAYALMHHPQALDRTLKPLIEALDEDFGATDRVLVTLGSFGSRAREALPRIRQIAANFEQPHHSAAAFHAWWRIGGDASEIVGALEDRLGAWSMGQIDRALLPTIADMGPRAAALESALRRVVEDEPERAVRNEIEYTLHVIGGGE